MNFDAFDLVQDLANAPEPSRKLDERIAAVAGWQRVMGSELGFSDKSDRLMWVRPGESKPRLPKFTESINAALELVNILLPKGTDFAFARTRDGDGAARVEEGEKVRSCNEASALCLAVLSRRLGVGPGQQS